jgi:hypothetical protein
MTTENMPAVESFRSSLWHNAVFLLAVFGLAGGFLAGSAVALLQLQPDLHRQSDQAMIAIADIRETIRSSPTEPGISSQQADEAIRSVVADVPNNPYLKIQLDDSLSASEKQDRIDQIAHKDRIRNLISRVIGFGLCGVFVSICLSIAEPIVDRNSHAAVINGSVGAALGLAGGLAASLVVDRIYHAIAGPEHGMFRQYFAQSLSWAVLGCFLAVAPGVVAKNQKRLLIGLIGGAVGGAVGGILLDPIASFTSSQELGQLAATCCIGLITGVATGIIELAARTGWLKVTAGIITGKQFILYRNPTYIGSAPDCQIYLFKDPQVGRRHAALHLLNGRIEIEDLPLGSATLINNEPITRRRLRHGDQIRVGSTAFLFQEKTKEN